MWRSFAGALCAAFVFAPAAWAEWPACGRVSSYPGDEWRQVNPSARGWDAAELETARQLFEAGDSAAVMVVHRGRLIAQWGSVETRYTAQSVRKALISSLVGQMVGDGRLRLDATLSDLGIDDADIARLARAIIAAHPQGDRAFTEE